MDTAFKKVDELNGELVPHITGVDLIGEEVSLSMLKGKLVYVDFWATWCGPCIAEFPHSIALKKKLPDHEVLVFLYISMDKELNKW